MNSSGGAALMDEVGALLREVAAQVILPRFRALASTDIEEKQPGELVTIADREAEQLISARLLALLTGSRVVGEERCAEQPELLQGLDTGLVWLVDPLDGTRNFIAGSPVFSVMVTLLRDGDSVAAWLLDPVSDKLVRAQRGAGAECDGVVLRSAVDVPALSALRGAVLTRYMPPELRAAVEPRLVQLGEALPGLYCAGAEYPAIVSGQHDFALFWRTLPWDHAPGALVLTEAGGAARRLDDSAYRPGAVGTGLLVARTPDIWQMARRTLFPRL